MIVVGSPVPSSGLAFQGGQVSDPTATEALPGKEADFDFRLVQPTAVFGRVVKLQSPAQFTTFLRSEGVAERLAAVNVEVVEDQMNRARAGIVPGQGPNDLGEFPPRSVGGGPGEVPSGLRLHRAENIRCPTALVLAVPLGRPPRRRL